MKQKQILFIYSYDRLHILFKMTNNRVQYDSWPLNTPSAATHMSQKTMFHGVPCAILNYLGSNGSYILSIHI